MSATLKVGAVGTASSLRMVPVACALAIVAPVAPERLMVNVSLGSDSVSPLTATETTLDTWPGEKVRMPEPAV
jgi:hypothetical protein